jgi:hypothetical protein
MRWTVQDRTVPAVKGKAPNMKEPEYAEGQRATENFEEGMKALFSVPKDEVVQAQKKAKKKRGPSSRKPKISDKD